MTLTPERAAAIGSVGGLRAHALHDPHEMTKAARRVARNRLDERLLAVGMTL